MTIIPAVIAWSFTLTFVVALVLVLLDVAGIRRIRDRAQRKWLFRSLFGSVILAVVGFGSWQFDSLKQAVDPSGDEVAATNAVVPQPSRPRPRPDLKQPTQRPAPPTPNEADRQPAAPPEVAAWARETLGERPVVPAAFERDYPACVAELRGRTYDEIDPADASDCRGQLSEHHVRYVLGFYQRKEQYDRALRSQEIALRRSGVRPEEAARYNFVLAENEDFNDPGGPTLQRIEEAEDRVRRDMTLCRTRRCTET